MVIAENAIENIFNGLFENISVSTISFPWLKRKVLFTHVSSFANYLLYLKFNYSKNNFSICYCYFSKEGTPRKKIDNLRLTGCLYSNQNLL